MKNAIGYCKYCGQSKMIEVPDSYEQDYIDADVTDKCTCPEATAESKVQQMITHTEFQLKEMLKENSEDILARALYMVEPIARNRINKLSIGFGAYTLSMKAKPDKISLSLKYTEEDKRE